MLAFKDVKLSTNGPECWQLIHTKGHVIKEDKSIQQLLAWLDEHKDLFDNSGFLKKEKLVAEGDKVVAQNYIQLSNLNSSLAQQQKYVSIKQHIETLKEKVGTVERFDILLKICRHLKTSDLAFILDMTLNWGSLKTDIGKVHDELIKSQKIVYSNLNEKPMEGFEE